MAAWQTPRTGNSRTAGSLFPVGDSKYECACLQTREWVRAPFNPEPVCAFVSVCVCWLASLTSIHTQTCWQFITFLCSCLNANNSYEFSPPGGPGLPGRAETHSFTHLTTHAQTEHHLWAGSLRAGPERLVQHTQIQRAHTHTHAHTNKHTYTHRSGSRPFRWKHTQHIREYAVLCLS